MAELKAATASLDARTTKIRNVPIAVTPEGFWCCPSQAVLQKTAKNQNQQAKTKGGASPPASKASSIQRAPTISSERRTHSTPTRSKINSEEQRCLSGENAATNPPKTVNERPQKQHKVSVGFGQLEMSDLKVVLYGKDGVAVKMSVHKNILAENSTFFADKLSRQSPVSSVEVTDCDDVEIYVETVGLMYCSDVKQRLIKQTVPRVLRILKVCSLKIHSVVLTLLLTKVGMICIFSVIIQYQGTAPEFKVQSVIIHFCIVQKKKLFTFASLKAIYILLEAVFAL